MARRVVKRLLENSKASFFARPVDEASDGAPGYLSVVKRPMDLGSILLFIECDAYEHLEDVRKDVAQVWENCRIYNDRSGWGSLGNVLRLSAEVLDQEFEEEWRKEILQEGALPWSHWLRDRRRLRRVFPTLQPQLVHTLLSIISLGTPDAMHARRLGTSGIRCECDVLQLSNATVRTCLTYVVRYICIKVECWFTSELIPRGIRFE